jgi:phage-related tail protein
MVGERGPELVNFRGGESVTPNNKLGGQIININFTGSVYGMLDFEQKVKSIVKDTARSGGFRGVLTNG